MASASRDKSKKGSVSGPNLIPAGELAGRPPIPLTRPIIVAGSRNNCRLHLISRTVSKAHALIVVTRHSVFVRDLASREGTFVNGDKIGECDLAEGDILKIGRFEFIFSSGGAKLRPHREKQPPPAVIRQVDSDLPPVPLEGRVSLVGRRSSADVAFVEPTVSTAHAVIVAWEGKRYIRDLGSRTGTFVNGKQVHQQELQPLDQIRIGESDLAYEVSTPGDGVEVVVSATDSAVATAIAAQEIEAVPLSAEDTATPAEKPRVAPPATRPVRPAAPVKLDDSIAEEDSAQPAPAAREVAGEVTTESPLADSIAGVAIDDVPDSIAGEAEDPLSRRGWHRGGTETEATVEGEAGSEVAAEAAVVTPIDLPLLTANAEAPTDLPLPPVEVEAIAAEEAPVAPEPESPIPAAEEPSAPLAGEPAPGEELAIAEAPTGIAADEPTVEVVEGTDPDTAQSLEAIAPPTEETGVESEESVVDLTDTVFRREVKALTDTNVGEPVEIAAEAEAANPVEAVEPVPEEAPEESPAAMVEDLSPLAEPVSGGAPADGAELELSIVEPIDRTPAAEPAEPPPAALQLRPPVTPVADLSAAAPMELEPVDDVAEEPLPVERQDAVTLAAPVDAPAATSNTIEAIAAIEFNDPAIDAGDANEVPATGSDDTESQAAAQVEDSAAEAAPPGLLLDEPTPDAVAQEPESHEIEATIAWPPETIAPAELPEPATETAGSNVADVEALAEAEVAERIAAAIAGPDIKTEPAARADEPPPNEDVAEALDESAIEDLLATPEAALEPEPAGEIETLSLPVEPAPVEPDEPSAAVDAELAPAAQLDSLDGDATFDETSSHSTNTDDILEVPAAGDEGAHETAFALVVPPLVIEPEPARTPPADETAVSVVMPAELLPSAAEPKIAPEPPAEPLSTDAVTEAPEAAPPESESIAEPPPLPLNAPTVTEAVDDTPSMYVAPTPRRPKVIRDGFNRRGRRSQESEAEISPFASGGESIIAPDPFGAVPPADVFTNAPPSTAELPPADPAIESPQLGVPDLEPAGEPPAEGSDLPTRRVREFRPSEPTGIHRERPVPSFGPDIRIPTAAVAEPEDEAADLHELRRRRLKLIPTLLVLALLLAGGAMGSIWYLFPVQTEFETAIKFGNFDALTIKEQRDLQDEQLRLLRIDMTRRNAVAALHSKHPAIPNGFLGDTVGFERAVMLSGWPESRKGEFVIRYRGTDPQDRQRVQALTSTMYALNQTRIDNATRVRAALRDAQDKLDSNKRKLDDLKAQLERERVLGESRPKPGQIEEMQTSVLQAEKAWTEALAKLKDAQAEEARIDKLLHGAQDNPPAPPEKDEELVRLNEQLTRVQAEYKALQTQQSEQAAVARGEIDTAMDAFQKQIEAARGQGAESPELINYIAAAENLQKTARELLGEMLDRQQKQYQQLSQLKASLDDKAQQRAIELRNSDPQLKDFYEKRELLRRQINAGIGSGVARKEIEPYEDQLKLTENMIKSREELLSSDPLYVETITSLQAMIDKMQADIAVDRKKADEKMEELQRSFAASSPAVANLPDEQKKLAEQVRAQLGSITMARKRYADILEADRLAAERKLKEMQGQIVALQGEVESRKQLLTDEFASKSVTSLTATLDAQRKVVAEAQTLESVARAEFESRGKDLRAARDTLEALKNSDERMARLISDKETTEGLVASFARDVQFRQEEAKRLLDVQSPGEDAVKEIEGKDPRPTYYLIALASILALTAVSVFWTLHSAHRLEFAPAIPDPIQPTTAIPAPKNSIDPNAGEDTPAAIA